MDLSLHPPLSGLYPMGITLCIPVYNDWDSAARLLQRIDDVAGRLDLPIKVLLVDDGSSESAPSPLEPALQHIVKVEVLHLRRNVGHQRAIALGLAYLHDSCSAQTIVVMDGDGEDDPRSLPALLPRSRQPAGPLSLQPLPPLAAQNLIHFPSHVGVTSIEQGARNKKHPARLRQPSTMLVPHAYVSTLYWSRGKGWLPPARLPSFSV